jgi:GTPase SAR1 family protein
MNSESTTSKQIIIFLIANQLVGKSCLIHKYVEGIFNEVTHPLQHFPYVEHSRNSLTSNSQSEPDTKSKHCSPKSGKNPQPAPLTKQTTVWQLGRERLESAEQSFIHEASVAGKALSTC